MSHTQLNAERMSGPPTGTQTLPEIELALASTQTDQGHPAEMLDHDGVPLGVPGPRFEATLMILLMIALTAITLLNVIVRYLTNASFAFTEEVSSTLMLALVLVGSSAALYRDRHIRVNYLIRNLPKHTLVQLERVTALAFLVGFGALVWYGGRQAWEDYDGQASTASLGLPSWTFSIWLPLISLLICLRAIPVLLKGRYEGDQP